MKDKAIGRMLGFFLAISAIMAAVAVVSVLNINRSEESADWVNHTHAVILEVSVILGDLHAADGSALTYAVSADPRSKAASRAALADLAEHLATVKALTRSEPSQRDQILHLETLANKRADVDRDILNVDSPQAARPLLGADSGVGAMAEIQGAVENLTNQEIALLEDRDRTSFRQARTTRWTVWTGAVLDILLLAGVAWLISDDIAARRIAATALKAANEQLEAKVRERTAELAAANQKLTADILERSWANQALEHQLRYNQLIIDSIADLVFVLTKAVNISRINPAVVRLTGLEPQELINRPLSCIVTLTDAARGGEAALVDPIVRALADGRDLRDLPAVLEDKRGGKTQVRLALYPLRDRDKVVGGIVILQVGLQENIL